jgi:hypothetical protein
LRSIMVIFLAFKYMHINPWTLTDLSLCT